MPIAIALFVVLYLGSLSLKYGWFGFIGGLAGLVLLGGFMWIVDWWDWRQTRLRALRRHEPSLHRSGILRDDEEIRRW